MNRIKLLISEINVDWDIVTLVLSAISVACQLIIVIIYFLSMNY